jgi:hypothetical protein
METFTPDIHQVKAAATQQAETKLHTSNFLPQHIPVKIKKEDIV